MSIRTILVAVSGGSASNSAIDVACCLAKRYDAHLEGFHVRVDPRDLLAATAGAEFSAGMVMATDWMDQVTAEADQLAAKTKETFFAAVARNGIVMAETPPKIAASACWREEAGYGPFLVSRRARFFDLIVLGRSERVVKRPHTDTIEEALLHSGRPILVAPADVPATCAESIAIGWNGSAEAVRALGVSLPLLTAAHAVTVLTIGDSQSDSVTDVMDYLGWQGIIATHRHINAYSSVSPGEQLLTAARDAGADLLVMGGYGQSPWHEFLFGGVTRKVIGECLMPVLLSH